MTTPDFSLLSCYCGEKHIEPRCPNLDLARLVELGRLQVAKDRLMKTGVQFEEWAGEDDSGWWFFVRVEAEHCEVFAEHDYIDALRRATQFASIAQTNGRLP